MRKRTHWKSAIGGMAAIAGSAVGLGSLWVFPRVMGENGILFFLIYFLCTFILALPVLIAEMVLGREKQAGVVIIYFKLKGFGKYFGVYQLCVGVLIIAFYSVLTGYTLMYTVISAFGFTSGNVCQLQELWQKVASYGLLGTTFVYLMCGFIAIAGVKKGIERMSEIAMPTLLVIMVVLLGCVTTMPSFGKALQAMFSFNPKALHATSILKALGIAIFGLSTGLGVIVSYGSYMHKDDNIPYQATCIGVFTCLISFLATMIFYPIALEAGVAITDIGFLFSVVPILFKMLPLGAVLCPCFFFLFFIAAFTSVISIWETLVLNASDYFNWDRSRSICVVFGVLMLVTIPLGCHDASWSIAIAGADLIDIISSFATDYLMPIAVIVTSLFITKLIPNTVLQSQFKGRMKCLFVYWRYLVRFVVPLVIFVVMASNFV